MSLLRAKNEGGGSGDGRTSDMPTMRPVSMGRPLVTMSTYQERGETLKRTSFMPDDSCYRNNNNSNNANNNGNNRDTATSNNNNNNNINGTFELPPPPPQFANTLQNQQILMQPQQQQQQLNLSFASGNGNLITSRSKQLPSPLRSPSIKVGGLRAPATPQPDYEMASVQLRSTTTTATTAATTTNGSQQQRRTLRLGTVTIGEYGEQRGKRETLRKTPSNADAVIISQSSNGILKNGSRSSASFSSKNNINGSGSSNNRQQMQPTEKTIKFGN